MHKTRASPVWPVPLVHASGARRTLAGGPAESLTKWRFAPRRIRGAMPGCCFARVESVTLVGFFSPRSLHPGLADSSWASAHRSSASRRSFGPDPNHHGLPGWQDAGPAAVREPGATGEMRVRRKEARNRDQPPPHRGGSAGRPSSSVDRGSRRRSCRALRRRGGRAACTLLWSAAGSHARRVRGLRSG